MNFFELFNQAFELNARQVIKPAAFKLYMYWLHEFNQARWPALLYRRANQVYVDLGIDKNTFVTAVTQLEARGLLAYESGKNGRAGEWYLNYDSAIPEWVSKVKNSPQPATFKVKNSPQVDNSEVKNSPSFHPNETETFDSRVKNSPPIRNRQNIKEDTTQNAGVGEAAEEITLVPLPAENSWLAPPFAEPPRRMAAGPAAEPKGPQHSEASKALAAEMALLWQISRMPRHGGLWGLLTRFTHLKEQAGQLEEVRRQFAGYCLHRQKRNIGPHDLKDYLGSEGTGFEGIWCQYEWPDRAAQTRAEGESAQPQQQARATTSARNTQSQEW